MNKVNGCLGDLVTETNHTKAVSSYTPERTFNFYSESDIPVKEKQ